jgi:hypothetical protein
MESSTVSAQRDGDTNGAPSWIGLDAGGAMTDAVVESDDVWIPQGST